MARLSFLDLMERNPPRVHWTIDDVQIACGQNDGELAPPRGGGSHYKCTSPWDGTILMIPQRRPIKPVYIRFLVGFIRKVRERQGQ